MHVCQKIHNEMSVKDIFKELVPQKVWKELRLRRIISDHKRVADLCDSLIEECMAQENRLSSTPLKQFDTERIIWQYWAQGFGNVPPIVAECLSSVDRYKGDFQVVRLTDANYGEYIRFPECIASRIPLMSKAHFSDLLRVSLLSCYGGVWMDATIKLTGPIPEEYTGMDYFVYQRDPEEPYKDYWENAYAYYYGWAEGFRVNMLSSFMASHKGNPVMSLLSETLLFWWQRNDYLPDYFFLQIMYDVVVNGPMCQYRCPVVSDCLPHYLQQSMNDPAFILKDRIKEMHFSTIHKLTYK